MKNKIALALVAGVFWMAGSPRAWADDWDGQYENVYIKSRAYVGGFGNYTHIDGAGQFNGSWGFQFNGNQEVDLIPAIDRNFGFGGLAGYRWGSYAGEISYWRTEHNGTWGPFPPAFPLIANGKVVYHSLNVDFKRYLFPHLPAQPFVSAGLSFPWVVASQASGENSTGIYQFADMSISGIGLNLGVGMELYLGPHYSIVGAAVHRWAGYNQITGALKQNFTPQLNSTDISVAGNGLNFYAGATIGLE
jgi:hypothetical protein